MELVVLMAGKGQRFVDAGIKTPKPFVLVKGKTILQWTLSSVGKLLEKYPLSFAIRKDHEAELKISESLKKLYGENLKIVKYDGPVKGNLHTGLFTSEALLKNKHEPVLFLDSDNMYETSGFEPLLSKIKEKDFAVVCYFELEDKSDLKWGFCAPDQQTGRVSAFREKAYLENGMPMFGFFFFSSAEFFEKIAKEVMEKEQPGKNNEYYMTQGLEYALKQNFPVYGFKTSVAVPLGTPEDVEKFAKL